MESTPSNVGIRCLNDACALLGIKRPMDNAAARQAAKMLKGRWSTNGQTGLKAAVSNRGQICNNLATLPASSPEHHIAATIVAELKRARCAAITNFPGWDQMVRDMSQTIQRSRDKHVAAQRAARAATKTVKRPHRRKKP